MFYKKSRQMGSGHYVVEISTGREQLWIAAHDVDSPESFLIELAEKRG